MHTLKGISLLLLACFASTVLPAQRRVFSTPAGSWTIQAHSAQVLKAVFQPVNYRNNEAVSDAVIARPVGNVRIPVQLKGDTLLVGQGAALLQLAPFSGTEYRGFRCTLQPGERIYGGGERALPQNRRGYRLELYNAPQYGYSDGAANLNFSIPYFTSSRMYSLFFDNPSKGYTDIGLTNNGIWETGFVSGELAVYITLAATPAALLKEHYLLTGRQPLPPRWALGNFMSRFGYTSEKEVNQIAAKMKQQRIPVDGIIYDLFWFGDSIKGTLGNLDWVNRRHWPNPTNMLKQQVQQGYKPILIAEPFILQKTRLFQESQPYLATDSLGKPFMLQDFYFGVGGLLDVFKPATADWLWKQHYQRQLANGVMGWWTDLGEPEKHPAAIRHNLQAWGHRRLFGADEVHNVYGHYWNKMLFNLFKKHQPNERLFHLNRSGFAGSQRFSIFPWSGDVSRSWEGLRAQVPLMLGMSMSGIPYIHSDAGGFAGGSGDGNLYVRWLQYAVYTPIFRPHGTALYHIDPNAFSYPSEPALVPEPYRTAAARAVRNRYALLPYHYTMAYRHAVLGEPLAAPLYYYYPTDTTATSVNDSYCWGASLLVAPVTEPNCSQRKVYLPAGHWYALTGSVHEWSNAAKITGPAHIEAQAGHDIPVFAKGGAFVPVITGMKGLNTEAYRTDSVLIHYFYDAQPSEGMLYDDDGRSANSIESGAYECITFKGLTTGRQINISITSFGSGYTGRPTKRSLRFRLHGIPAGNWQYAVNNREPKRLGAAATEDGASLALDADVVFDGKPVTIQVTPAVK